jgi:hypothetical protein
LKSQLNDVQFGCDGDLDPCICEVIRELEREMEDIYVDHPFGFRRGFSGGGLLQNASIFPSYALELLGIRIEDDQLMKLSQREFPREVAYI